MPKITTFLAFNDRAEEAANFYISIFNNSKITKTIVIFLHLAPIVVGGGIAIGLDRLSLRLSKSNSPDRTSHHSAERYAAASRTPKVCSV